MQQFCSFCFYIRRISRIYTVTSHDVSHHFEKYISQELHALWNTQEYQIKVQKLHNMVRYNTTQ